MRKRVAIYFTGGTISMKYDPHIGAAVPILSGEEIVASVPELSSIADYEIIDFGRYPGPHMTPQRMMELSDLVRQELARTDIDGVAITHGTDTLEETAYLLDLTVDNQKPVAVTGAMRNSSETGWDGPANLMAAVRVAASSEARGLGTMVVMNETILAAADVSKTATESFDAFESPDFGPIGVIDKGRVIIRRMPLNRSFVNTSQIMDRVFLIKVASGSDSTLIEACLGAGARGLVIEAMGRGNVPPGCVTGITTAISTGVPVIMVSRCQRGRVYDSYGYPGGGKQLKILGVISGGFLNGQKARIKLALALSLTTDAAEIRKLFEAGEY
ncbi:MAG TPA: asparaginase [Blastocatellia bacterium]|nr:asparaginase [Blastocatellia bacterium]